MKILFVHASADMSTADVGNGYARALRRLGHEVADYRTSNRIKYHVLALRNSPTPKLEEDFQLVSLMATENIVVEALREQADLVIVTCGAGIHPDALELCNRAGFPIAVVYTESPYEDEQQLVYARHVGHHFTNDAYSANRHGWTHLPAAYDPDVHHPYALDESEACDVLIIGTGWPERQRFLEQVSWRGIHLRLVGYWPDVKSRSRLRRFREDAIIDNRETARLYSSAKVCVNFHRGSQEAESLNPRAYELAACGTFQVSDWRPELDRVFAGTVPVYRGPEELTELLRYYLRHDDERRRLAEAQRDRVLRGRHTFDDRAVELLAAVTGPAIAV